uniref:Immunoglobulin domain-containing protein n=1 Tax=Cyprinus carpio TaxID=7962 RepID=A0A8C1XRQ2_CYPCA
MTIKLSIEMKSTLKIVLFLLIMCGVFCAETDEVKSVSVMEGDAVTLNPDLTQIKGIVLLLWRFGDKGSTVAQIDGNEILYEDDEIFIDRLQLDQSGSLTIKNTRTKHTGLYEAEISHNTGTSYIRFSVTVYESPPEDSYRAEMKSVPVTEGDPVALRVPQLYGDELIVWRFGDEGKLIAKHDIEAKSSSFYDETDERFRNRLELDPQTGSLIITNTKSTDSGLYIVKISSNKQTSYQKYFVTISVPGLSPAAVAGIVVVLLVIAAAAAAAGVLFYRRRTSELKHQKSKISECHNETSEISEKLKRMSEISEELKQMTEDCEKELPEISEHHQTLKISERLKQMCTDATKEEMEKGERERRIVVKDTAISQATGGPRGADGRVLDMHGKSLVVRNTSTEHTGVHESTGKGVNEDTPFIDE